jgi:uncharacterized protein
MGLIKFILFILLIVVFFFLLKKFRKPSNTIAQQSSTNKMMACHTCKMHIPENEAIIQNSKTYCSVKCLEEV